MKSVDQDSSDRHSTRRPESCPSMASPTIDLEDILGTLNLAQLKAVKHDPSVPLQILAGPGSGKTKVLISRIAQLILSHNISPSSICAVTFTNKAANEMRERLTAIIGKPQTTSLQMGTFHSLCARFLRLYAHKVNLETNFTICDADESKKLISALLKPYKDYIVENDLAVKEGSIASVISRAKAKGSSAATFYQEAVASTNKKLKSKMSQDLKMQDKKSVEQITAEVYAGYEQILKQNNALDFDDLLIYGVKLFSQHIESVLWCKHILVDEFQDTNTMQYELMKSIAVRRCVTIVGDPDQSIYGWRSAEVINLARMRHDFPNTQQIFLEQNYRSTAAILRSSLAIVSEDKNRIDKSLHTSNPLGSSPVIREFESEKEEAAFIAFEIKRCVANMGGVLRWGDFVVLLRFNALSRPIESGLQREGIPCRILGGHKFFERMEVKDILTYLQLADNPCFDPAFIRAIKVPTRGIGDKTLADIATRAASHKISHLQFIESVYDNKLPDFKPSIKRKIASFVQVIRELRKLDADNVAPSEMIRKLVILTQYEDYLKKTQQDWESRWENVQELITFASEIESEVPHPTTQHILQDALRDAETTPELTKEQSLLRQFLQASMLSSEGDNQSEEEGKEKVTLSTCHAAKGLEWPVVIIPSVDQDTFPFYRTEDIEEERRLLYVACTRAQSLLYLTHSRQRQVAGKTKQKKPSDFISVVHNKHQGYFSEDVPRFLPQDRAVISTVLQRSLAEEAEISKRLSELASSGTQLHSTYQRANGGFSAISLTGVRLAVENEASSVYAAPDALAAISASFTKDYKKSAFNAISRPSLRAPTFDASFRSASLAVKSSVTSNMAELAQSSIHQPIRASPQSVESPRQGSSNRPASNQTSRQFTLDQKWLSSKHRGSSVMTSENEACRSKSPRSDYVQPGQHSLAADSTFPSYLPTSETAPKSGHQLSTFSSLNGTINPSKIPHAREGTSFTQMEEKGHPTPIQGTRRLVTETQISGQQWNTSKDHRPSPPEVCTPMSVSSGSGQAHRVLVDRDVSIDYDIHSFGIVAPPRMTALPQSHEATRTNPTSSFKGANTTLPHQMVNAPDNSHAVDQNVPQIAMKRRLGMGRTTGGYSNKKFKRPV